MQRITYYDTVSKRYILLKDKQENIVDALGKLEDYLEEQEPRSFQEYMYRLRTYHKATQELFAYALNIKPITIQNIENGTNLPSYKTFRAIAQTYDIPLNHLRFVFRRYVFHLKDEALDYIIDCQDDSAVDTIIFKHIGTLIQSERRFMSMSKERLSSIVGVSVYVLTKIENGELFLPWQNVNTYGKALESDRLIDIGKKLKNRTLRRGKF